MIAALANCCANKILVKEKFGAHTRYSLPQKQPCGKHCPCYGVSQQLPFQQPHCRVRFASIIIPYTSDFTILLSSAVKSLIYQCVSSIPL